MPDEKIIQAKRHILLETDGVKEYPVISHFTLDDSVEFDSNNAIKNGLSLSKSLWEGTKEEYEADYIAGKIAEGATVHITDDHDDVEQDPIYVDTFSDIATTYPNPQDGWTVNVKDTDYTYRYDGSKWVVVSANSRIPQLKF